jgi:uncharacterized protein with ParB-like and HNH nuclease domain
MSNGILPPELKSIEGLLSGNRIYSVPKYQRNFSWTKDEVQELWEDTCAAVEAEKMDFFLGTIVVRDLQASLEIIDGQQRLACISMISSAIRNAFMAKGDDRAIQVFLQFLGAKDYNPQAVAKPRLVLNQQNNPTYLDFVISSADAVTVTNGLKDKTLTESNRLLLEAYKFFLEEIGKQVSNLGTRSDEFIVPLLNCLRSSVKVISIPVQSEEDAFHIFEALNARGKDLAVSDLVKNRLYSESGNQIGRAQQLWEKMEGDLVRRPIPEYLRHYWIAKRAPENELKVREKALYRTIAANSKGPAKAVGALTGFGSSARSYAMIEDYTLWPNDPNYDKSFELSLSELKLFRVSQCYPVLLNAVDEFKDPKNIAATFRIVANFSFRYNIIGGGTSGDLESVFGSIAYGIRSGTYTSPTDIADTLRGVNPDSKFRLAFESATIPKSKARLARHVLGRLNDYMGGPQLEMVANKDPKVVNLEHILPQKPDASWKAFLSPGIGAEDLVDRIGNLTLLILKTNDKIGNKPFQKKQLAYKKSKLKLNTSLKRVKKWSDREIEKRQKELAKIALEVWKL